MKFFFGVYDHVMVLQLLAVSFSLVWVFRHIKLERDRIIRCLTHLVICFLLGTFLNFGLFEMSRYVSAFRGINFALAWLITIVLYLAFFSKVATTSKIIMGATMFVTVITMADLGRYGALVFADNLPGSSAKALYYIVDILIVGFGIFIKKFSISKYTDIPPISARLIMLNSLLISSVVFVYTRMMVTNVASPDVLYCFVLFVFYIMTITGYLMIWYHCQVRKEKTELEVENRLLEADSKMLLISEKAIEDMKCLRHDIKNQYQVMKLLLQDGKYDALNEYFKSMDINATISNGVQFIDCGNELLNSIINMEMIKASSLDIDFTTKVTVSGPIAVEKSDLCRVLVNIIDNAIEAADRYNAYDKSVDCKISDNKDFLYICVRNGLGNLEDKTKPLDFVSEKKDPTLHGYGHRIVEKLVNKYNGYIKYSVEEDEFVAEVMLGLKVEE